MGVKVGVSVGVYVLVSVGVLVKVLVGVFVGVGVPSTTPHGPDTVNDIGGAQVRHTCVERVYHHEEGGVGRHGYAIRAICDHITRLKDAF